MSIDLDSLKAFVRVAELGSFTQAAQQLGMPKARASAQVQKLEAELGTQLLQRSTRMVRLTTEGEQLLKRAHAFLAEADDLGSLFHAGRVLRGRVRVELPVYIAAEVVIPRLPEFLARYPQLVVDIGASDRIIAAAREGFDVVLRMGQVKEVGLVGRRLGEVQMANYASPSYLRQYGTPRTLADLRDHLVVHFAADPTPTFEYFDGEAYREVPMRSVVTVDHIDSYSAACRAGLGIVQTPRDAQSRHVNTLVEVLPEFTARPMPISLLHTHGRSVPKRVRVVMSWLTELLSPMVSEFTKAA